MDCPVEFRENYISTDEAASDTDDSEPYEPKPCNNDSSKDEAHSDVDKQNSCSNDNDIDIDNDMVTNQPDDSVVSETESESDDNTDCSTDSEDGDDGADDSSGVKMSGNNDDANQPHQAHCIQVILQNGRMINVNAERSNDFDNPLRETNGLRCVIGIINGRGLFLVSI